MGLVVRQIADQHGHHRRTVYREIARYESIEANSSDNIQSDLLRMA